MPVFREEFLYQGKPANDLDLWQIENHVVQQPESLLTLVAMRLVSECRRLQHELNDPNYQYSGRIHRNAVIYRDAEIDKLKEQVKKLESELKSLKGESK